MAGLLTFIPGKRGYVKIRLFTDDDSEQYQWLPFTDWGHSRHADFIKRNVGRFDAVLGYQDGLSGFKSGKITFKFPVAIEVCPLTVGEIYDVLLGLTSDGPLEYRSFIHVTDLNDANTAEDGPMTDASGDTVGVFDYLTLGDGLLSDS